MMSCGAGGATLEARVADDRDFTALKALLATEDGWALEYERAGVRVWTEAAQDQTLLRTVKVVAEFPDVSPDSLYDVLHDPEYRAVWDSHMIAAEEAGYINVNNDVGYYAMSCPAPLKNRDFVLQRSWLDTGQEKLILNHSVYHKNFPPRKGFVRAISMLTGFVVRALPDPDRCAGSWLGYVSRSDPRGALPAWLVNRVTAQLAPRLLKQLHAAARKYPAWKSASASPGHKPWLFPHQVPPERISIEDCVDPEAKKSPPHEPKPSSTSPRLATKPDILAQSVEDLGDFSSEFSLEVEVEHADAPETAKKKGKFYKMVKSMKIRRKSVLEKTDKSTNSSLALDKVDEMKNGSSGSLEREEHQKVEEVKPKKEGFKFHRRFSRSK